MKHLDKSVFEKEDKINIPIYDKTDLNFGALLHVFLLRDGVGDDDSLKTRVVDARDGRPREDAVS